jgi:antirestriction protein ArdC
MDADALRKAKLAKLIEIEGFDSIEELMEAVFSDAVSPAICVNEDCDFTSYMKGYTVFNADQCDGLPAHYYAKAEPPALTPMQRLEAADRFFAATGADIRHGGTRAYYAEGPDYVQMPPFETFRDAESFAATLGHELTHWMKHGKRLARDFGRKRFGDEGYAVEELVAELGAAFLCADLDLTPEVREDHAAYIATWITVLKNEKRAIFSAAAHAQRAVDYLHGLQPQRTEEQRAAA